MFFAERGRGAFLNGELISVCTEESMEDSLVSVSWVKRKVDRRVFVDYIEHLSRDTSYFRRFGTAALVMAYVASGRIHAYLQGGLNPWDVAAGVIIIEEAGGVVTDFDGRPIDLRDPDIEILTANPVLHSLLMKKVISHRVH
jgi:myo-inositol-1(or 4)-monophosphatase